MSTVQSVKARTPSPGIPFIRLVRVELRKQVDTVAGRWLLVVMALMVAVVVGIMFFVGEGRHSFASYLSATTTPLLIGIPIIGVLSATSEWSQRTGLSTFALEPRRERVVAAKAVSTVVLGLGAAVVATLLAAGAHGVAVKLRGAQADWSTGGRLVPVLALIAVLGVLQGVGFGLSLMNTPMAIVTLLLVPTAFTIIGNLIPGIRDAMPWIDMSTASAPFLAGHIRAVDWARLAVTASIWVLLPLLVGLTRVRRSEIR